MTTVAQLYVFFVYRLVLRQSGIRIRGRFPNVGLNVVVFKKVVRNGRFVLRPKTDVYSLTYVSEPGDFRRSLLLLTDMS